MSDQPDFEQIARDLENYLFSYTGDPPSTEPPTPKVVETLREIWNARGAADREIIDDEVEKIYTAQGLWLLGLNTAIKGQDR